MENILRAHHLEICDIEPEALQMCLSGLYDIEAMERVARISATNKYLNSHGYPGLPLFPAKKSVWETDSSSRTATTTHDTKTNSEKIASQDDGAIIAPKKKRIRKSKIQNTAKNDASDGDMTTAPNSHLPPSVLECMSEEEIQKGAKMGLNAEEYFIIKGDYGKLFDLELDQNSFYHMIKKCKTKIAINLRSNREESVKYLKKNLLQLARNRLKSFDKSHNSTDTTTTTTKSTAADDKKLKTKENMKHAADFLKVLMAMHPPLPQHSPYATTTEKRI
jgi:predicted metal-binding transcription factor (methanogenesis marker protein 9)